MHQSTYNRITFACSALIVGALLFQLTHCGPFAPSDNRPVMAYELDGTYCTTATPDEICLTVRQTATFTRYWWSTPTCQETGTLTGGLEFWPDTASRLCMAPDPYLYSAGAQNTPSGLAITIDQSPSEDRANGINETITLELNYVSYSESGKP